MAEPASSPDDVMTVAEFLAWNPGDGRTWQFVDGVPLAMALPSPAHGTVRSRLDRRIGAHLDDLNGPCFILTTPGVVPRVRGGDNMRVPDLAVSCSPPEQGHISPPVLVVEVLSPGNRAETWGNVWAYTTIASVQEVLVMHSTAVRADLLRRRPDGMWPDNPDIVLEGDLVLDSIAFRTPLLELYRYTLLNPDFQG